jgi:hypothetical protein
MAEKRARVSTWEIVASGWASRVSKSPTATPMRLVPKSNARTVPVLGRGERGEERGVFRIAYLLSPYSSPGQA